MPFVDKQNLNDIINKIQQDKKLQHQFRTSLAEEQDNDKVYTDEPILMTADKIKSFTPSMYKELKQIIADAKRTHLGKAEAFYEQARFMEHFEDDYEANYLYATDLIFFPTYDQFNQNQLRQYFSWRTRFRKGQRDFAPRAFIFLYIYELLHNIGIKDALDGLAKLQEIDETYKNSDNHTSFYLYAWIRDYIIYNNLPKELGRKYFSESFDEAYMMFSECQKRSDAEVLQALTELAGFNIMTSKVYKKHAEAVTKITANVIRAIDRYYESHAKYTMGQKYFGIGGTVPSPMFDRAVFFDYAHRAEYRYKISEINEYICQNGRWTKQCAYSTSAKSAELGNVLRTLENELRVHFGMVPLLKEVKVLKTFKKFIAQEIAVYTEAEREAARQREAEEARAKQPQLDLSKLAGIRAAAADTRDKLLTDEERGDEMRSTNSTVDVAIPEQEDEEGMSSSLTDETNAIFDKDVVESIPAKEGPMQETGSTVEDGGNTLDLTEQELHFMQLVLHEEDAMAYARSQKLMLSVLIDSINEKFYDEIGDTVLDFDGLQPILIEDYIDDVKQLLGVE